MTAFVRLLPHRRLLSSAQPSALRIKSDESGALQVAREDTDAESESDDLGEVAAQEEIDAKGARLKMVVELSPWQQQQLHAFWAKQVTRP